MFPKNENLSIAALVEELNPLVAGKDDFACRDEAEVLALFGTFRLSWFWCKEKNKGLIYQKISTSRKFWWELTMENTKLQVKEN